MRVINAPAPQFVRYYESKCTICNTPMYRFGSVEDRLKWEVSHREIHDAGKCADCNHLVVEHIDSSVMPEPEPGYHKLDLVCNYPTGQGGFCGCGTVEDEDEDNS